MNPALLVGAVAEILTWVGLGAAAVFGAGALVAKLADGTWVPIRAVLLDDVGQQGSLRWFGDDGVHTAPLTDELREAADGDEVDAFHRVGSASDVRLHHRSPLPRLLGGVALACGGVGVLAVVVQVVAMVTTG
ncbi:hypothetical protein [Microbacterium stercoris]|uniref:Sortase n=1 Tax=Microbacterium stercoris TaxID=2820289 RepID=A0A939QIX9_9MICO|nr:hypothetical protein [Microbacterium stercoris]MBO3663769.1 hypothetical protein [Microbacterium stercoris]